MRIVQICDAQLSQDKPLFSENWAWIADRHPDLLIHTGDCAGVEVDLGYSAQLMDELGIWWRGATSGP
jgi:hypothetical protein